MTTPKATRTAKVQLPVTPEEKAAIQAAADAVGIPMAVWIRLVLLGRMPPLPPLPDDPAGAT